MKDSICRRFMVVGRYKYRAYLVVGHVQLFQPESLPRMAELTGAPGSVEAMNGAFLYGPGLCAPVRRGVTAAVAVLRGGARVSKSADHHGCDVCARRIIGCARARRCRGDV